MHGFPRFARDDISEALVSTLTILACTSGQRSTSSTSPNQSNQQAKINNQQLFLNDPW
jgi:hypothetical protein